MKPDVSHIEAYGYWVILEMLRNVTKHPYIATWE